MLSLHGTTSIDHKLNYSRSVPGMLKIRRDNDPKRGVRNDEYKKLGFLQSDLDLLSTDELLLQCKAELMIMELKAHCSA
jgi:hypothetical protein